MAMTDDVIAIVSDETKVTLSFSVPKMLARYSAMATTPGADSGRNMSDYSV